MAEDGEGVGRFDRREKSAHAATEATTDEGDLLVFRPQLVARPAKILELREVVAARTLPSGAECDRAARDVVRGEAPRERAQDRLRRGAAVSRREDRSARQRALARIFGSFCSS